MEGGEAEGKARDHTGHTRLRHTEHRVNTWRDIRARGKQIKVTHGLGSGQGGLRYWGRY